MKFDIQLSGEVQKQPTRKQMEDALKKAGVKASGAEVSHLNKTVAKKIKKAKKKKAK